MDQSFVIGAKKNLGLIPLLKSKILAPNLRHKDHHMECEEIWVGPQCKAIPSNPIGNLDNLGLHHLGPR